MGAGFCSCSDDDNEEIVEPAKAYAIEAANDLTGGVIAINPTNAEAGATVTLTATPADGFAFVEWHVVEPTTVRPLRWPTPKPTPQR